LRYKEGTGFGTMLVDANNSFNKLSRYVMLWHCRHAWPHASHFAFNRYRHFNIVIFQNGPGEDPCIIFRWGNPHPIRKHTKLTVPQSVQLSYDDDASGTGNAEYNAKCLTFLVWNGPAFGYFPEPANAIYICKGHDKMIARHHFEELGLAIRYS